MPLSLILFLSFCCSVAIVATVVGALQYSRAINRLAKRSKALEERLDTLQQIKR